MGKGDSARGLTFTSPGVCGGALPGSLSKLHAGQRHLTWLLPTTPSLIEN